MTPADGGTVATTVHDLSPQCLTTIFKFLDPVDLGAVSCAHKAWRDHLSHDDSIWRDICCGRLGMGGTPEGPDRAPLPTYRTAFRAWYAALGTYGELGVRATRAWRQLEDWTRERFPEVAASLRPGASEEALAAAELELGVRLPPALRVLYRLHDGQGLQFDASVDSQRVVAMHPSIFHGLFGGYAFYSHVVSTRMLPLRRMVRWTQHSRARLGMPQDRVLFAASFNFGKMIYCDTASADVKVACVDKQTCLNAAPPSPPGAEGDGVLRWVEAYAAALLSGRFAIELLDAEMSESRAISLFPQLPPWGSEAVTRGVRVRALPVFVPEQTMVRAGADGGDDVEGDNQYLFAYSVRFSLLEGDEQAAHWPATAGPFRPLTSVQLRTRHWLIRDARGNLESEVRGEAVVGHYPLLTPGAPEFVYQSCTHQQETLGTMEGDFVFVEGSLQSPAGPEFEVVCAPFHLEVPDYIF